MSSASPGTERAALAILLRRRRSCSEAMSNTCVRILVRVRANYRSCFKLGSQFRPLTPRPMAVSREQLYQEVWAHLAYDGCAREIQSVLRRRRVNR